MGRWMATSFKLLNCRPKKLLRITRGCTEDQFDGIGIGRWASRTGRVVRCVWVGHGDSRGNIVAPSFGHKDELAAVIGAYAASDRDAESAT